ncbi:uncharacterized protein LOC123565117 [Mercenaria mercenaria]|uniref:uncharacterized protein LOC123565117 n=1 Tax=Mercenaria mercenaria TaxID=6596 RepID=UPI00234EE1C2|nr:uncharacterized protein LOC123565117 [Mercenaria mercenaria]XP_053407056.1 uncharacterized protein LOC123565117 [Mercenaria mercenaria]
MLDPCNSFLDSEPEVCVELEAGTEDLVDGDFGVTGTLFATLLSDVTDKSSTDIFTEVMSCNNSDSESDEILDYLSKTQENLMKEVSELQESVRLTRSSTKPVVSTKDNIKSTCKQSVYSRPPLMCSSTVNMKSSQVEIKRQNSLENPNSGKNPEKCMNKNAIIARENREKKKQYVKSLENNLESVKNENFDLKTKLEAKSKQCELMQKEIKYLRNVLANQSCISALLNNIHATKGVAFTSSLQTIEQIEDLNSNKIEDNNSKKRSLDENDNYEKTPKGIYVRATGSHKKAKKDTEESMAEDFSPPLTPCSSPDEVDGAGGVCLHVSNNKVSLELCSICAESASNAWSKAAMIDVAVKDYTVKEERK